DIFNCEIDEQSSYEIAMRSRGTPRIANRLLKRVRDFAQVKNDGVITQKLATSSLDLLQVDGQGLDSIDYKILECLIKRYDGRAVGLETIAITIGEESITIEDVYEPYLVKEGFIERTPRGRRATPKAYKHLGIEYIEK
ncbi:Holliday junction DNA helicase RuvB C-terminal domain-containing protein, partial [Gemella morbillorum]